MSRRPIDRSPELKKLRDEGFDIEVADGYLLMHDVPYVNEKREVKRGILMAALNLTNDIAQPPSDHQSKWAGDCPCNEDGSIMQGLGPTPSPMVIAKHQVKWNFSCKPKPADKYDDFHHKMSQYAIKISGPAMAIEPAMTARTFKPRQPDPDDSVFLYEDTASSRAEIVAMNDKLKPLRIGIVGLGGTGSYVLDFVAKTPVKEIIGDSEYMFPSALMGIRAATRGSRLLTRWVTTSRWRRQTAARRRWQSGAGCFWCRAWNIAEAARRWTTSTC